jgi:germination protein M
MSAARRHRKVLLVLGALLLGLVPACGDDGEQTSTTTTSSTTTAQDTTTTGEPPASSIVRSYFLREEKVGPVAREAIGDAVARGAMVGLLQGPTEAEQEIGFSTTIPEGTELLGLSIDDGTATVDLSEEFGSGGGSLSMSGRVAQVVYTLTQFPTVSAVLFELEGEPVSALGGEGLEIGEPQTRADWEALTPAILVESPLPFDEVASPLEVRGTANTFEAMFQLNVTDGEGLIVYDQPQMASSGTGTRGTFDVTATFEVSRAGAGEVIVFESSAKDGSPINVVEIPVQIS